MFLFIAITSTLDQDVKNEQGINSERRRLIWSQKPAAELEGNRRSKVQEIKASWELEADNHCSGLKKDIKTD